MSTKAPSKNSSPEEISYLIGESSLGWVLVAFSKKGVCFILLGRDRDNLLPSLKSSFPDAIITLAKEKSAVGKLNAAIQAIENPHLHPFPYPLDLRGTDFQKSVWHVLQTIPAGETRSYAQLAEAIGNPKSHRAVASACAHNRHAIIIPCHRVLRSDGKISGYRWGVDLKKELLKRESEFRPA